MWKGCTKIKHSSFLEWAPRCQTWYLNVYWQKLKEFLLALLKFIIISMGSKRQQVSVQAWGQSHFMSETHVPVIINQNLVKRVKQKTDKGSVRIFLPCPNNRGIATRLAERPEAGSDPGGEGWDADPRRVLEDPQLPATRLFQNNLPRGKLAWRPGTDPAGQAGKVDRGWSG